jgi:hypothetical protein
MIDAMPTGMAAHPVVGTWLVVSGMGEDTFP